MRFIFQLFVSMAICHLNAQMIHGSYAMLAICKDGIIIAADSRSSFVNPETHQQLCYFDTTQKVFPFGDAIISFTGSATLKNKSISFYVNEFLSVYFKKRNSVDSTITDFVEYVKTQHNEALNDLLEEHIFLAKYSNNLPCIANLEVGKLKTGCSNTHQGYITTDTIEKEFTGKYYPAHLYDKSCKEVSKMLIYAINNYIKSNNKQDIIGGPIMIIKISDDNKITWICNEKKTANWSDYHEFKQQYLEGKISMKFLSNSKEKEFNEILSRF